MSEKDVFAGLKDSQEVGRFGPDVIARDDAGGVYERARTRFVLGVSVSHGFEGVSRVELFESVDDEDRGGVVLMFKSENYASAFHVHVVNKDDAVELHIAGDCEAAGFVEALTKIVEHLKQRQLQRGSIRKTQITYP